MEQYSHAQIAALEEQNWWYATRRRILASLIRQFPPKHGVALDVGCGVGSHHSVISRAASRVIGLDISRDALDNTRAPYDEKVLASVESMPLADGSVDFVVCTDVLEHVDDDVAVRDIHRVLSAGGVAYVTVPAFEALWNENDDYGHHLRRYRKKQLKDVFERNGFRIDYLGYWNRFPFFPVVWIVARFYTRGSKKENLRNNLSLIPSWLNTPLDFYMRFENRFLRFLPFGVSLVLVARK